MNRQLLLFIPLFFLSCKKEPATDSNIALEGRWKYQRDSVSWMILNIDEDSKGDIFYNGDDWPGKFATLTKTWYVKENQLLFGRNPNGDEAFIIETHPTIATNEIPTTFDTIIIGQKYMYLDGNLYIDQP